MSYRVSLPCTRPDRTGRPKTCLQAFAEGWILAQDLCAGCTGRLMAGLDIISDEPLAWHSEYAERASEPAQADNDAEASR